MIPWEKKVWCLCKERKAILAKRNKAVALLHAARRLLLTFGAAGICTADRNLGESLIETYKSDERKRSSDPSSLSF